MFYFLILTNYFFMKSVFIHFSGYTYVCTLVLLWIFCNIIIIVPTKNMLIFEFQLNIKLTKKLTSILNIDVRFLVQILNKFMSIIGRNYVYKSMWII